MKQVMSGWQWHQLDHMQIICTSLQADDHASTSPLIFTGWMLYQPTVSGHWRQNQQTDDAKYCSKMTRKSSIHPRHVVNNRTKSWHSAISTFSMHLTQYYPNVTVKPTTCHGIQMSQESRDISMSQQLWTEDVTLLTIQCSTILALIMHTLHYLDWICGAGNR